MKGQSWTVTFTKVGVYRYVCNVHPPMTGSVTVLPKNVDGVTTQAKADATAASMLASAVAHGEASAASVKPSGFKRADGTNNWEVIMPPAVGTTDVMRFVPARLRINVNDTVTWIDDNVEPHTVTFTSGAPVPDFVLVEPKPAGPPTLAPNPLILFPQGSNTYDGTGFRNSGFLGIGVESHAVERTKYSLKFTKAGTYTYLCVIHANWGMSGVIEVGGALAAPRTGDAGLADGRTVPWQALAGVAAGIFAAGALVLRTRRA
jgi:plastocyanin